ncbi:uncharacterized protein DUF4331 [Asanoa ferruginea]|uniref:Uncharacterized protein DUF4331 n=1 Tax=Asanoa ferruginea TaxID=53367 RepID=A0A3D9ZU13_9ACTN|nr:DUF4331 domain-containing protein [Asanoa ferruginea]REG00879.1 uncharacterized protein DUF4331 [Asanoa ferruginea]GIF47455.1 hypothetical protein Afe04nite_19940 [Asanoa ferruginea]
MRLHLSTTRKALVAAATVALAAAGLATLQPVPTTASSHREAPLIAGQPRLDNTDLYAFVSPDAPNTVTMIANWTPFEEPNGGPNFYPFEVNAAHDINIDNNGDARPDITYRWTFSSSYRNPNTFLYNTGVVTSLTDPDLNFNQTYKLERITSYGSQTLVKNARVAPSFTGKASMPNYGALAAQAVTPITGGRKTFAGNADDSFFLDLRVFDLLYGGNFSEVGQDTLAGYNVNTIAFQVPKSDLALRGDAGRNPVVGVWTTTSRSGAEVTESGDHGGLKQVSRLGNPLVNEVVIPVGRKNEFNATKPQDDAKFAKFVTNPEVPRLVQAIYGIPAPPTPRNDLVEVFLTGVCKACGPVQADLNSQLLNKDVKQSQFKPSEMLRLNMSIPPSANPNRLGVVGGDLAGFPNGRRLADDVLDITLQAAEGILLPNPPPAVVGLGDQVNTNNVPFRTAFPYIALPNQVAVNQN